MRAEQLPASTSMAQLSRTAQPCLQLGQTPHNRPTWVALNCTLATTISLSPGCCSHHTIVCISSPSSCPHLAEPPPTCTVAVTSSAVLAVSTSVHMKQLFQPQTTRNHQGPPAQWPPPSPLPWLPLHLAWHPFSPLPSWRGPPAAQPRPWPGQPASSRCPRPGGTCHGGQSDVSENSTVSLPLTTPSPRCYLLQQLGHSRTWI